MPGGSASLIWKSTRAPRRAPRASCARSRRTSAAREITANCVALGATRTPAIERATSDPEAVKRMLKVYQIKRLGEPEDAANMILFLSSDASSWITGQTIPVNGGYSFAM